MPHRRDPAHLPRYRVWPLVEAYDMPLSELERMGGPEALRLARNHRDPQRTVSRACMVRLLGECELDRLHPLWGYHRAALAGDPDACQQPRYRGARTVADAERLHAAAVRDNGERVLAAHQL